MLEVTDSAVSLFKALLHRESDPTTGVRIEPGHNSDGDALLRFHAVNGPSEGDVRSTATGLEVFVASELAETLGLSVLDLAQPGQVDRLVLRAQLGSV